MVLTIISLRQIVCPGMTVEANQTGQQDGLLPEKSAQLLKLPILSDSTHILVRGWRLYGCADV